MNLTACGVTERMDSIQGFKQYFIHLKKYNNYLSVCLSVSVCCSIYHSIICLSFRLSFYYYIISIYLSFYNYVVLSVVLSFYHSVVLSIYCSVVPSIFLSFCCSVHPLLGHSICLPACLSVVLFVPSFHLLCYLSFCLMFFRTFYHYVVLSVILFSIILAFCPSIVLSFHLFF